MKPPPTKRERLAARLLLEQAAIDYANRDALSFGYGGQEGRLHAAAVEFGRLEKEAAAAAPTLLEEPE